MAKLRPWYQVITPREDLRENRPLDASEFAVHLDHIRDNRAHADYMRPERFFDRTFMTKSLLDFSAQVVRRFSGNKVETSAVFNMATQFGGGKTHSLTALYHLAQGGEEAKNWRGVSEILTRAQVGVVPKAAVAVFVGTEFDVIDGRGGNGEPHRKTPWGEIAWQLGGEKSFAAVAKHDEQGVAPGGDVIRKMLPEGPSLILMDELLNYVNRARKSGLAAQLYSFIQNLSEEARAQDRVVLCVSIPASELEMTPEDQRDFDSYKKLLDRVGKAVSMSSETETTEIIRRRLFEFEGVSNDMRRTASAYAEWARDRAAETSNLGGDNANDLFLSCYPFHPSVISVFERKWQSLNRFQRTRGILRLLALWVSRAYGEEHRKASSEPLITLGSAPFDDQTFRDAVFEQLGSDQLSVPVTTDIAGKKDSHANRLDKEATESIRKARLHQKVATTIFMESNGGQSRNKAEASLPEIRAAVGGPDVNLADVETVLEGLASTCYYLNWDRNRYRFGLRPNLNQILVTRRGAVTPKAIEERVQKTTEELFRAGPKFLDRRFFPERSNDIPDKAQLTLVVLGLDRPAEEPATRSFIEELVKECGASGRTYKSGLLFVAPDSTTAINAAARDTLAWEDIDDDSDTLGQLEDAQRRALAESLKRAKADLKESIWRAYRHVLLLDKTNNVKDNDLGQINSSMANSLPDLIVNTLQNADEITDKVAASRLVRYWPPALVEWSTKAVRDAFFASPALPRLIDPNSIKQTIADGVSSKLIGYARRDGPRVVLERFGEALSEHDVEIDDDIVILKAEDAQRLLEPPRLDRLVISPDRVNLGPKEQVTFTLKGIDQYGQPAAVENPTWSAPGCEVNDDGRIIAGDVPGLHTITARHGDIEAQAQIRVIAKPIKPTDPELNGGGGEAVEPKEKVIRWRGSIPPQKWTTFYMKVVSPFVSTDGFNLTVAVEIPGDAQGADAQVEKIQSALRDLGFDDSVDVT